MAEDIDPPVAERMSSRLCAPPDQHYPDRPKALAESLLERVASPDRRRCIVSRGTMDDDPLTRWIEESSLDRLFGHATDIVAVIARDLVTRYINFTGPSLTRDAVVGQPVLNLSPPNEVERLRAAYEGVLRTGEATRFELHYGVPPDTRVWDTRLAPIRDADAAVVGMLGITTEVAERRRRTSDRDRFFQLSLDMRVVASPGGRFRRVNQAFADALGYDPSELEGRPFLELVRSPRLASTERGGSRRPSGRRAPRSPARGRGAPGCGGGRG